MAAAGIEVVAFSVEDEATTRSFGEKHGVRFRLGHSADLATLVEATGAYDTRHPVRGYFLETSAFVLAPDGTVASAVYSSRAIGRLVPEDVMRFVAFLRSVDG